ncbi:MAG: hypothetical protein WA324_27005 [Bryobacteraceae bacterium]
MNGAVPETDDTADWPRNYFNYFTEIEDHFQRARGTSLFLLSPLDWALIESWKNAGVPLAAVQRGIDDAFDKWRSRKNRKRQVNSLAYCAQAVMEAAQRMPAGRGDKPTSEAPFAVEELQKHLRNAAEQIGRRGEQTFRDLAASLQALADKAAELVTNLEDLERRLTAMEDKLVALAHALETEEALYEIRASLDSELKPYRGKMTAEQLSMLERRYLDAAILERAGLPRLSLFYLR